MTKTTLAAGHLVITAEPQHELVAPGLGSCVAVIMFTPAAHLVGMAHVALPHATTNPERAREQPGYFADTAIPAMLDELRQAAGGSSRFIVKLVGGATMIDPQGVFGIGKRNLLEIRKILWQHGLGPLAEDTGADYSRTVRVSPGSGRVLISSPDRGSWEI